MPGSDPPSLRSRFNIILVGRYIRSAYFGTGLANVMQVAAGSIGGLLLARGLGPAHRGDLVVIFVWPVFVISIVGIGLPQAATYWVSRVKDADAPRVISTATIMGFIYGGIAGIAGSLAAGLVSHDPVVLLWLRVRFLLMPVDIASGVWSGGLQALDLRRWNWSRVVQPGCYLATVVALTVSGRLDVSTAAAAMVMSTSFQALIVGTMLVRRLQRISRPTADFVRPLIAYGARTLASGAPWLVNAQLDQIILSVTVSAAALGNYSIAVSLSQLCLPLSTAFGAVAFPRIAGADRHADAKRIERVAALGGFLSAVAVLIPLACLAPWVVTTFLGAGYHPAIAAFWLLVPGAAAYATNSVLSDVLRGWGRPLAAGLGEAVAVVITVALLALLVPLLGIRGASIASSCAYISTTIVLLWMLRRVPVAAVIP